MSLGSLAWDLLLYLGNKTLHIGTLNACLSSTQWCIGFNCYVATKHCALVHPPVEAPSGRSCDKLYSAVDKCS